MKNPSCSAFSYTIYSNDKICTIHNSPSIIFLGPSSNELTFAKTEFIGDIDDRIMPPNMILVNIPFTKTWLNENLNGIYHKNNLIYEKVALYDKSTNITLERNNHEWTFKNSQIYGNEVILAKTSSNVDHPGLFTVTNASWSEITTNDTETLDQFPTITQTHEFSPINDSYFIEALNIDDF